MFIRTKRQVSSQFMRNDVISRGVSLDELIAVQVVCIFAIEKNGQKK